MFTQNRANNFSSYAEFLFEDQSLIEVEPLKYNLIEYSTPSYNLSPTQIQISGKVGTIPGDTIEKDQSQILRFILDEDLKVFFNLLKIMEYNSVGHNKDILNINIQNNKHDTIALAKYSNVWISNISSITYSTTENETIIFIDVTMNFLDFNIKSVI